MCNIALEIMAVLNQSYPVVSPQFQAKISGSGDPGLAAVVVAAAIVAGLYAQGGIARTFAGFLLLVVLITPVQGMDSILLALLNYLDQLLTVGIGESAKEI